MMNVFEKIRADLQPEDLSVLQQQICYKSLKASEFYNSSNSVVKKVFVIKKGLIRSFYKLENDEERTLFFRWEGHFCAAYESIVNNEPTKQTFQAIEDCEILEIDYDIVEELSKNNPRFLKLRITFMQKMMTDALKRVESFVLEKPIDRYLKLISEKPDIINRVPDKHIASFIGVTPVSLSRIRKRIASHRK